MLDPTPTVLFCHIVSCCKSVFFGCEQGRRWVWLHQEARANKRWANNKNDQKQIQRTTWLLSPWRGGRNLKIGESLFISLAVPVTNSYCRSQFCHIDTVWSTILLRGWLRLWVQVIVWVVAVRSPPWCCDRDPQKGQRRTQSLLEAFLTTLHP